MNHYDLIVVGLGAVGSSALYQASKRKAKVLGIDRFTPPHTLGSSHGETRIIRQAIGEGDYYVPLVLRSYEILQELEKLSQKELFKMTGGLILTRGSTDFFNTTIKAADKYNIEHKLLNSAEVNQKFPEFNVKEDTNAYFEYNAGYAIPEDCISAQLALAQGLGASIHDKETLLDIIQENNRVIIRTDKNEYQTKKLIMSLGAWINRFLDKKYSDLFKVYQQVLFWFDIKKYGTHFEAGKFPIFIWEQPDIDIYFYGFPPIDGPKGGLKLSFAQYDITTNPDLANREVAKENIEKFFHDYIADNFHNISHHCLKTATCFYTQTPDKHFVIDFLPNQDNIIIASPCSGHGFKHSFAVGEILAEMAMDGHSKLNIDPFKLNRFVV